MDVPAADPYHNTGQAMGLSFSVPQGVPVPSSLQNIYKELNTDLGCTRPKHGCLLKVLRRQHLPDDEQQGLAVACMRVYAQCTHDARVHGA